MRLDRHADSLALAQQVDALCDRFEEALRAGKAGDWWDWLPPVGPARGRALAELARLDMEYRLRAGEPVRVEAYLARHPELKQDAEAVLALITREYEVRRLREPELTLADYDPRFPDLTWHLRQFDRPGAQGQAPSALGRRVPGLEGSWGAVPDTQLLSEQGLPPPGWSLPSPGGVGLDLRAYQLLERLGSGGMGEVYLSRDPGLDRLLALKVLRAEWQGNPDMERRFQVEARITGSLQHPAIVPVYDLGRLPDGRLYFTMKVVRGRTFADMLAEPGENAAEQQGVRLGVFAQVCQAVAYAHSKGVIHRDLKPDNVMVGRFGEVQVLDWGLAKILASRERERPEDDPEQPAGAGEVAGSRPGEVGQTSGAVGTLAYMAPEQANGEWGRADERLDVFGLGGILCAVLTGQPPYVGDSPAEVRRKVLRGDLGEALARLDGCGADAELVALAKSCLAAEAAGRPRDGGAVAKAVTAYQGAVRERLRQAELGRARAEVRAAEERKRRRLTAALAAAGLALLAALAAGGLWLLQQRAALRRDVEELVAQAARLRRVGHFDECQELLGQAGRRLGSGGPADLRGQVDGALADAALARRLDEARQRASIFVEGKLDYDGSERDYAAALAECGLAREGEDEGAVGARVRGSAVREEVVAALDDWAGITRDEGRQAWLLAAARAADPDPDRARLREPALWRDQEALARLAEEGPVAELSPQLTAALARALSSRGGNAVPLLRAAQALHSDDFWLNFELGGALYQAKEWGEAVGYYRAALALRPRVTSVHNNLGAALHGMGRVEEAIGHYKQALRFDPKLAPAHNNLGGALHGMGRGEEAIGHYEQALRLDPKLAPAHNNLGSALAGKGQVEEAIGHYEEALRLDSNHANAHFNLGNALKSKGRVEEAIEHYEQALRLDPKLAGAHVNLGAALAGNGRVEEAIGHYEQALHFDPKLAGAHVNLGAALAGKGQMEQAIDHYEEALRLDPKLAGAHVNLGAALHGKGQVEAAIGHYEEALRLDPNLPGAHFNLGSALEQQGKLGEALDHLRQAATLLPTDLGAQAALRNFLLRHGRADEARLVWRKALDANPPEHNAWHGYAELCLFLGREDEYRRARRNLLARFGDSTDPLVAERVGRACLLLPATDDELRRATAVIDRALAADPKTYGWARPFFLFARGLAEYRRGRLDAAAATLEGLGTALGPGFPAPGLVLAMARNRQGHPEAARQALAAAVLGYDWSKSKADNLDVWICHVLRREAEALILPELPALLAGSRPPRDNAERLALLGACQFEGRHAAAARLYAGAFAADPQLAEDFAAGHRYNAARHATLAASGRGADAPEDDKERARLRGQALDWLKAALTAWGELAEGPAEQRLRVRESLTHWRADPDLACVRDKDVLAKLPEDERAKWQELWGEVDNLLERVGDKK
jgi:serine/threonine-protein kinase